MTNDKNFEVARLQKEITKYIGGLSDASLIFDFHQLEDNRVKLDIITVNPIHRQSFLFQSVEGFDKVDALFKMLQYVQTYKEKDSSYTIQWSLRGQPDLHTSYFRAKNVWQALDKLTHGRDMNALTVYSVVLNPIS